MGEALLKRHKVPYYTFSTASASGHLYGQDVTKNEYPTSSTDTGGKKTFTMSNYISSGSVSNIFALSGNNNIDISTSKTTRAPYNDGTKTYYSTIKSYTGVSATMSYSGTTATVNTYSYSIAAEHMLDRVGDQIFATMGFSCLLIPDTSKLISIGSSSNGSTFSVASYAGLFSSANDFVFKFSDKAYAYNNASSDGGSADAGVTYGSGVKWFFVKSLSNNTLTCSLRFEGNAKHNNGSNISSGYMPITVYLIPSNLYYNAGAI